MIFTIDKSKLNTLKLFFSSSKFMNLSAVYDIIGKNINLVQLNVRHADILDSLK